MCNKNNLPNRIEKAKAATHFASCKYDRDGKLKSVVLPGSNGKSYQVIIRRNRGMSTELILLVNGFQTKPSYAAQVTYHQMAAVMLAASKSGYRVTWCANRDDAARLARLGGRVFGVRNHDNPQSKMWAVMKERK